MSEIEDWMVKSPDDLKDDERRSAEATIAELRRQLTEKESQLQRAVLAGVKAGVEECRETAAGYRGEPVALAIDLLNPEAIAAKVKL